MKSIKFNIWLGGLFVLLMACTQSSHYKLTADFPGVPDGLIFYLASGPKIIDSATILGGHIEMEGQVYGPTECILSTTFEHDGKMSGRQMILWMDNSRIHITCPWDSLPNNELYDGPQTVVSGSAPHAVYGIFQNATGRLHQETAALSSAMLQLEYGGDFSPKIIRKGIVLARRYNNLWSEINNRERELIARYPTSPVTLRIFADMLQARSQMTLSEVSTLYSLLDTTLHSRPEWDTMQEEYDLYCRTARGEVYTDFAVTDEQGNAKRFSDYFQPGKFNLLVCWASWCNPCRKEIPHLKHIHSLYGDRLSIIAVSADKDEAAWKKALQEEKPSYTQVRMAEDKNGISLASYYGLKGIPYTLLLDGEGRIIASDVFGGVLDVFLEDELGNTIL